MPSFCVNKQGTVDLSAFKTDLGDELKKKELKDSLEKDRDRISELQTKLYTEGTRSLLLIFQAMDAAGKDSCIRHVMSGVNPQGCNVHSFKAPNSEELSHDFLWRHAKALPAKGMVGIHNRSHYEEVLVVKVHPEYLLGQHIPGIMKPDDADKAFWEDRYASIREFEAHLARQGTVVLKFFLHMSKAAQKERFLERIEEKEKNWKFSMGDIAERGHWDAYQNAYEEAISATAAPHAPWFIVPADDQWESRAIVGRLVREELEAMDPMDPELSAKDKKELEEGKVLLLAE
ncbi:MAG: polyphosphate kinase 2 family protein [Flavobacteriales bacterium]|nr:polyphosphate kinase 2 family protein [Flavobacteriales bacterium]MBK6944032.1 polyphosphate kinase 2 family protein [Flavobacteriales bacterium]MBK7295480.1 polyphosphate kinase 2 family protein [Flavobacteriales bacterium]MBK9533700.1 polyphosphate kinase 2 family protein [Flavobacteriales bacterium]